MSERGPRVAEGSGARPEPHAEAGIRPRADSVARACIVCGGASDRRITRGGAPYQVFACRQCGIGRTEPRPDSAALGALYAGDYHDARARKFGGIIEAGRRACAGALARRLRRRVSVPGHVLDVGCGDGKLLVALARHGFRCTGIELNPRVHDVLPPDSGIVVHVGTLADVAFADASFDVVVLRHVLEHLEDPRAALAEIARVLEPGGLLVVAVPNFASWQARLTREHWFHLDLPRHLHHFTPGGLLSLLADSGFTVERTSHFSLEQNPFGWLQSLVHAAGGGHQALYDQLRARGAASASRPRLSMLAAAAALTPLSLALAALESAFGAGGTIEIWARRRP